MVSSRCQKRFIALVFVSGIALVFFYKFQQERSDYLIRGLKNTKDLSSVIPDRDKSVTVIRTTNEDEGEDPTDEDDIELNLTTVFNATEPPQKIHRGLDGNDEVDDTLDWLQEHGATPPPDPSPIADNEETTTPDLPDPSPIEDNEETTTPDPPDPSPIADNEETATPDPPDPSQIADKEETTTPESQTSSTQSPVSSTSLGLLQEHGATPLPDPSQIADKEETTTPESQTSSTQSPVSSTPSSSTQQLTSERVNNPGTDFKSTLSSILLSNTSAKPQLNHSSLPSDAPTRANNTNRSSQYTPPSTTGTPTPIYTTTSPSLNTCKLPNLNPWDPSISHLLKDVGNDPGCKGYPPPAFDVIGNRLVLSGEVNASSIDFSHVNVETIHRNEGDDHVVHYANQGNPFNAASADEFQPSSVINASDFFILKYKLTSGNEVTNYLSRVVPRQNAIDESNRIRQEFKRQGKNEGLGLNVVMLGFDSVSAANFRRKMPKSLAFLKTSLKTYFMSGQTVVGDATTPALTAMLTGLYETEPPEGRQGYDNSAPIDKWPWLMKLYKEHGYVTMMTEDDPAMGTFNLRLRGFEDPPAHHYGRPFWLALEQKHERDEPGLCSRSTFMVNYTLDYVLSYFASYPNTPKFAFAFMSYLTHAHPNHLSYADNDIVRLLRAFVGRNYYNNTVFVLFGDHGSRNDDVRNTMQGKLEERLPWLSISVPAWLEKKYPDITSALEHNQRVISSPFDVHATLHHVLTYPEEPQGEKTQSLFMKLNYTRTCSEAGVGEHWCPCLEFTDVDITSQDVIGGAEMAVKYINDVILNRTKLLRTSCARVQLKKIIMAAKYEPNEKLQRFSSTNQDSDRAVNFGSATSDSSHYRINFMTSPGDALFEATVAIRGDHKVIVDPNMSRTNLYGNQPRCILRKEPYARKFCYCKQVKH